MGTPTYGRKRVFNPPEHEEECIRFGFDNVPRAGHAYVIMRALFASPEGQITDPARALIATATEVSGAHIIPTHHHPRGQLLYAVSGNMRVRLGAATWAVSPRSGVWVPCGVPHQVEAAASVSYRSVFISPAVAQAIPAYSAPITIDALTRETILEAATFGAHYRPHSAESRLIEVLHDRLRCVPAEAMPIPLPRDTRARRICDAMLAHPADNRSLETWGLLVGASARTLARLFLRETGMTFSDWVRRMRLSLALDRLIQGETITMVALDLGYASPSAFCAMFRRTLGASPSHYLS